LSSKYNGVSEKKFVLSVKCLKDFKSNNLDIYRTIQEDLERARITSGEDLALSINNLPAYQKVIMNAANEELDVRKIISRLCVAIETRFSQVFDEIQEDSRSINPSLDRVLIEYTNVLGGILDKYHKFTESPGEINITNNITLQAVDQHIAVFHDVMKDVLAQMDLDTSLYFMEVFNEKMGALKANSTNITSSSDRLSEAKVLNETINKKLNE